MRPTGEASSSLAGQTFSFPGEFGSSASQLDFLTGAKSFIRPSQLGVFILLGREPHLRIPGFCCGVSCQGLQETEQISSPVTLEARLPVVLLPLRV